MRTCGSLVLHPSSAPPCHAPKQEENPDARHDLLADARAGLVRARLVQRVQSRRA
jgi:hypothetical protein